MTYRLFEILISVPVRVFPIKVEKLITKFKWKWKVIIIHKEIFKNNNKSGGFILPVLRLALSLGNWNCSIETGIDKSMEQKWESRDKPTDI